MSSHQAEIYNLIEELHYECLRLTDCVRYLARELNRKSDKKDISLFAEDNPILLKVEELLKYE
jgi:hypothetical protein